MLIKYNTAIPSQVPLAVELVNAKMRKCLTSEVIWHYVNLKCRWYSRGDGKANYGQERTDVERLFSQGSDIMNARSEECVRKNTNQSKINVVHY